jgi:hypothetical protein
MAWALEKRKRPKPSPVTIRYISGDKPTEVVTSPDMRRRTEEAKWLRETEGMSMDQWIEQSLFALKRDDTITVPDYTGEVWWFVQEVDGPAKAITADTLLFDQYFLRNFPFYMARPRVAVNYAEQKEATVGLDMLKQRRAKHEREHAVPIARAA